MPVLAVGALFVVDWPSAVIVVLTLPLLPLFAALIGRTTQEATDRRWAALQGLSGHFLDVVRGSRPWSRTDEYAFVARRCARSASATAGRRWPRCGCRSCRPRRSSCWPLSRCPGRRHRRPSAHGGEPGPADRAGRDPAGTRGVLADPPGRGKFHAAAEERRPSTGSWTTWTSDAPTRTRIPDSGAVLTQVGYRYPGDRAEVSRPHAQRHARADRRHRAVRIRQVHPARARRGTSDPHLRDRRGGTGPPRDAALSPAGHGAREPPGGRRRASPARPPWDVLRRVGLDGAVAGMPHGVDTVLGDDGFGLSAGQRARLAVARAALSRDNRSSSNPARTRRRGRGDDPRRHRLAGHRPHGRRHDASRRTRRGRRPARRAGRPQGRPMRCASAVRSPWPPCSAPGLPSRASR